MLCPLFLEFEKQFSFGDYVSANQRRSRIFQRIDDVAGISSWNIDIPLHRQNLLAEVKPAYDLFAAYMDECHPHLKSIGRHGTCYWTLEWHGLHQYLMVNRVSTESVERYIKADKFDRDIFRAARMSGEFIYFSKHPRQIDESLYKATVAPRYGMAIYNNYVAVEISTDALVNLVKSRMFFGNYVPDPAQMRLMVLERIDQIAGGAPIDTEEDRLALANKLRPLYEAFHKYLVEELPGVFHEDRGGMVLASLEWHALHVFLAEHGFTAEAVARYIDEDKRDRETFREKRLSGQCVFYSTYTLDPANFPLSIPRYAF